MPAPACHSCRHPGAFLRCNDCRVILCGGCYFAMVKWCADNEPDGCGCEAYLEWVDDSNRSMAVALEDRARGAKRRSIVQGDGGDRLALIAAGLEEPAGADPFGVW